MGSNIVEIEIANWDDNKNRYETSVLYKCNYNPEELVGCYIDGCEKLGFDPIKEYGPSRDNKEKPSRNVYMPSEVSKTIPQDKIEKLRQAGCLLFEVGDPVAIYPLGWAEIFMWVAKYGDSSIEYQHLKHPSVIIDNGDIEYDLAGEVLV